jgi:hypothetical protein
MMFILPTVLKLMALKPLTSRFSLTFTLDGVIALTPKPDKRLQLIDKIDRNKRGIRRVLVFMGVSFQVREFAEVAGCLHHKAF